jgi:hypothetical protein
MPPAATSLVAFRSTAPKLVAGLRRFERGFQPSEGCALSIGRGAVNNLEGPSGLEPELSSFVAKRRIHLDYGPGKTWLAAQGSNLEPSESESDALPIAPAANGWESRTRTGVARSKASRPGR